MLKYELISIGIILLVAIILNFALYVHFSYSFGYDQNLSIPTLSSLYNSFFVWSFYNYTGFTTQIGSVLDFLYWFDMIVYKLFGIIWGYIVFTSVYYWIGAFGIFLLVYELTRDLGSKAAYTGGLFATIIAIFEFGSHLKVLTTDIIFIPYVVLFTYLILKNIEVGESNKLNLFGLIIAFSFLLATGGTTYILENFIFLLFFSLFIFLILPKKFRFKYLGYPLLAAIVSTLMNSSWIITIYLILNEFGNQYFNPSSTKALFAASGKLTTAILGFGTIIDHLNVIILLFIFLIVAIGFLKVLKNKTNKYLEFSVTLALLIVYLIFVAFQTGTNKPFGLFFIFIIKIIPYLLVFRYTYLSTHYILLFVITILFGIGVAYIVKFAKDNKNKFLSFCIYILLFLFLITYLYSFDYSQIAGTTKAIIPEHVFNISNYINSQKGIFSIATLPMAASYQSTNWYIGTNIYSALIDKPTYTGSYTYYNEIFFPPSTSLYRNSVGSKVDLKNTSNISISNGFGVFGIHYIIVQSNALNKSTCKNCYISPFSFNAIYSNLNISNISFVKRFSNSSIYKNNNYVSLVYGSDLLNLRNATSAEIMDIIENYSFNIKNNSVFTTSIDNFYNDSNTINATPIANFSKPNISFVEDTPTKVTVHVFNATTPYYLVFRETYDPHWAAFYSNGTEVNPRDHIAVNGFANAWYMNKTGNYTITLYYTLQTDVWIAWGVSFAALFVTIGIGVYGWKESRRGAKTKRKVYN